VDHKVVLKEQKNQDRYDCVHADCSCGWHGQAPTERGAVSMGTGHMNSRGVKNQTIAPLKKLVMAQPPNKPLSSGKTAMSLLEQLKLLSEKNNAKKTGVMRPPGESTTVGGQEEKTS